MRSLKNLTANRKGQPQKEMKKPGNKNWTDQSSAFLPNNVN